MDTSQLRSELFRHIDGIATAPTLWALAENRALSYLLDRKQTSVEELTGELDANEGYLNVALRIIASQGWLDYEVDNDSNRVFLSINERSETAFGLAPIYEDAVEYTRRNKNLNPLTFSHFQFDDFESLLSKIEKLRHHGAYDHPIFKQMKYHIDGLIAGPLIVHLAMNGLFHQYFMEASFNPGEYHQDPENFEKVLDFFASRDWFTKSNDHFTFTEKGLFLAKRASAYGVTVSYLPTLTRLDELIFGDYTRIRKNTGKEPETHVDRVTNVWGSGGSHGAYFKRLDEVVVDIFNRPIHDQPKGILDMGCGNGAFLIHLFQVIEKQTLRGRFLDEHPLFLVGADFNREALQVTRQNLVKSEIWAKVIMGDVGDPGRLNEDLMKNYGIALEDLLNVRTFLDHNRIWTDPETVESHSGSTSTGAFAYRGRRLNNNDVEENLREHLEEWFPFIAKFGLLMIELHTIAPGLAARNIGKTMATAYDATHGYSDQYIIELDVFKKIVERTGLRIVEKYHSVFPDNELATVSVNYVVAG